MPTVPSYDKLQVREAPLPGVSFNSSVPAEAFGAGPSFDRAMSAGQGLADTAMKIAEQERKKADQLAVLSADTKLSALETDIQYNPKTGVVTKKGKDAFGAYDSASEAWKQGVDAIEKELHTENQRNAYRASVASRWSSIDKSIQAHIHGETQKYDDATTESYIANERDAASQSYMDKGRIGLSIDRQTAALTDHADRNGLPADWLKLKVSESVSKTHVGVIDRMLAAGEDQHAKAYYDEVNSAGLLTGSDGTAVLKALDEGMSRGDAQRNADKIWNEAGGDYGVALEKAREVKDSKTRQLTEDLVRKRNSDQKAVEAGVRDDIYIEAANLAEQNPGESVRLLVDPSKWGMLTPEQRSSLERRSLNPENDGKTWLDFIDMTPQQIGALSRSDFESKYWVHFDSAHKSRAEEMWQEGRSGRGSSDKHTATLSFDDRVRDTLFSAGMIPDKTRTNIKGDNEKTYTAFEVEAARRVEVFERQNAKKASGEDVQGILDGLVRERVKVKRLFGDKEKLSINVTQDERGSSYVPADKIPAADRSAIEAAFKAKRKNATKEKVERAYAAYVLKDRRLLDSILAE